MLVPKSKVKQQARINQGCKMLTQAFLLRCSLSLVVG